MRELIAQILTPDLYWLLPLWAMLMVAVQLCLIELAKYADWARFSRPVSRILTIGYIDLGFFVHALLNSRLAEWASLNLIVLAAGLPNLVIWAINKRNLPRDLWPGMGPSQLTLDAIALIENEMAYRVELEHALQKASQHTKMLKLCQVMLRHLRSDNGVLDLSETGMQILAQEIKEMEMEEAS